MGAFDTPATIPPLIAKGEKARCGRCALCATIWTTREPSTCPACAVTWPDHVKDRMKPMEQEP